MSIRPATRRPDLHWSSGGEPPPLQYGKQKRTRYIGKKWVKDGSLSSKHNAEILPGIKTEIGPKRGAAREASKKDVTETCRKLRRMDGETTIDISVYGVRTVFLLSEGHKPRDFQKN
jgi:hypothetical protein